MGEHDYITTDAPALIGVGVQAVVEQAQQLGLTWTLRPATVTAQSTASAGSITFDGDTAALYCINLTDQSYPAGTRVMGLITPTGIYIISGLTPLARSTILNNFAGVGSTSSATYVNMPAPSSLTFTKASSESYLRVDAAPTMFVTGVTGSVFIAVNIDGVDYGMGGLFFNTFSVHTSIPCFQLIAGIAAGTYTAQMRWLKVGGTGVVQSNVDDFMEVMISEVW